MQNSNRPLSPHLTIYRKQITSVLSILHRLTGLALVAGMALFAAWLWVAAYMPARYAELHECLASPLGQAVLFGWMFSFYYHFANGIRHLFWDIGKGLALPQLNRSGWLVIFFTLAATLFTWGYIHAPGVAP